jgi:hypothetical protein
VVTNFLLIDWLALYLILGYLSLLVLTLDYLWVLSCSYLLFDFLGLLSRIRQSSQISNMEVVFRDRVVNFADNNIIGSPDEFFLSMSVGL